MEHKASKEEEQGSIEDSIPECLPLLDPRFPQLATLAQLACPCHPASLTLKKASIHSVRTCTEPPVEGCCLHPDPWLSVLLLGILSGTSLCQSPRGLTIRLGV